MCCSRAGSPRICRPARARRMPAMPRSGAGPSRATRRSSTTAAASPQSELIAAELPPRGAVRRARRSRPRLGLRRADWRSSRPVARSCARRRRCRPGSPSSVSSLAVSTVIERLRGSAKVRIRSAGTAPLATDSNSCGRLPGRDDTIVSGTDLPDSRTPTSVKRLAGAAAALLGLAALLDIGEAVALARLAAAERQFEHADVVALDGERMLARQRHAAGLLAHHPASIVDRRARAAGQRDRGRGRAGVDRRAVVRWSRSSCRAALRATAAASAPTAESSARFRAGRSRRPSRRCTGRAVRCRAAPARDPRRNSSPRSDRLGGRRARSGGP